MKPGYLLLVLSCGIISVRDIDGARILGIFALQGKSHFGMFQEVMKALADAGHQVDVVSHFPQKKPYPNYTDVINLEGTLPPVLNSMTYELVKSFTEGGSIKTLVDMAGNDVCGLLELPEFQKLIKSPPTDPPYDLVIAELFFANCYFAFGRHLKVPVVALSSTTVMPHVNSLIGNPANPAIVSEIAARPVSHMTFWQRFENTFAVLYLDTQSRYHMKAQSDMVKKHFGPEMPDVEQLARELSLVLVNSHPIIYGVRPSTPAVVEVSGLHVRDDNSPIPKDLGKWLDDCKEGFIYFSLGSMVKIESFPEAVLLELYSAFSRVLPICILMKVSVPAELPPGLPDNVLLLSWVPQVQVLKHKNIRGFLTHGGLMGVQEALTFGVPLIGMPLFGDQVGNIGIAVERGVAVSLDHKNLKADEIVKAIKTIAHDPKYKTNMKALSKRFLDRPLRARDTAVFWIEYILRNGGDGLRSPAVQLTWWQLALLDVYGTVIAAVLIVLYILKLILSRILGLILNTKKASPKSKKRN